VDVIKTQTCKFIYDIKNENFPITHVCMESILP